MKPKCNREKLLKALLYEKRARKMLMKSTLEQHFCSQFSIVPTLFSIQGQSALVSKYLGQGKQK